MTQSSIFPDFTTESIRDCDDFEGDPVSNRVNGFTESGSHILQYWGTTSEWSQLKKHGSYIADKLVMTLKYVGRFGDSVRFEDLDPELQTTGIADALGVKSTKSTVAFDACGSRAEVANDPLLGNTYYFRDDRCFKFSVKRMRRELEFDHVLGRGKTMVWTNVAVKSKDQLRQRVAWALSQIFVLSVKVCCSRLICSKCILLTVSVNLQI